MKKYETPQVEVVKFETEAIMSPSVPTVTVPPTATDAPTQGDDQGPWG